MSRAPVYIDVPLGDGGKIPHLTISYWPDEDRFDIGMPLTEYDTQVYAVGNDRRPRRASRIRARIVPRDRG